MRRLTGFQPTGRLHLGNLLGAMRPLIAAQRTTESLAFIADLHAMTVDHDPARLRELTLETATVLLAAGVDPERTALFTQSSMPAHYELHYLLECTTGYGEAARMIQFKEKSSASFSGRPGAGGPVRLSLLTYPVLMAADILVHDSDEVPVGDDQNQHLELARTVAQRFNRRYGETFRVPAGVLPDGVARVMDLAEPRRKMSKSTSTDAGRIGLLDPPGTVRKTIMRAVTDTIGTVRHDPAGQPGVTNLLTILEACGGSADDFTSYGALKTAVADAVEEVLAPIRARHAELVKDPGHVRSVLDAGRERVLPRAEATVRRAREAIGLM
ncbi:tryptophan--tRNA ligase [Actinoplanes sp. NBRC 103695]|uniref:tryptophan--tRNA ligase n=1 Tax=Actinoplanes sp. NBRC 103695 TaxID=3032202 RepID=UPI0024A4DD8F|nr:tryptophan--tRNA ligase [Actinoplanes sp. NBRC 103695]GLZ00891.1 tryptophan--tRNA ligase 1 [Actinoplanes sp. NBRC 103695]